jgi:hypothetical protein
MNLTANNPAPSMNHAIDVMSEAFARMVSEKAIQLIQQAEAVAIENIVAAKGEEEKWDAAACASFFGYSVNWVRIEILNRPDFPAHCGISAHKKRWRASDVKSWHRKNLAYMQSLRGAKKKALAATNEAFNPSSLTTKKGGRPRKVK